jgi:solute carrier family 25 (adenine nucleotide translocator) protein 4/5/6/31|tara:strand:+ start:49 stop:1023 length:975 start_codon:yes stop_codon:yes gene_type:complete
MTDRSLAFHETFCLSGFVAVGSKTIAAPIERIKLLLQNQGEAKGNTKPYTGIMDAATRIPAEQGIASFWRGNLANCVRYFPTQALNFAFKSKYKAFYKKQLGITKKSSKGMQLINAVAAGGSAGATSLLVVYPLDFARTRLAVDTGTGKDRQFNGMVDCITKTIKTGGLVGKNGIYNGFAVSCVGIIFYRGAYFGLYDFTQGLEFMEGSNFAMNFALSFVVTTIAGIVAYPLDTIRRRMMMNSGSEGAAPKYNGSLDCAGKIMAQEGFGAFFKGAFSNILRGLCGALVLAGNDEVTTAYKNMKFGKETKAWKDLSVEGPTVEEL